MIRKKTAAYLALLLAVALIAPRAGAVLPGAPRFTIQPPTTDTTTVLISKFDFLCKPGLNNTDDASTFTVKGTISPAQPIVYPVVHQFAVGALADGGWTCYANTVANTGARTPTNRVSFSVQKPVAPAVFSLSVQ